MKSVLPVLASVLIFASCTTYKSGQTPDDVYYSPERPKEEYTKSEKKDDDRRYREDESAYRDDRYIRMKIHDSRYAYLYDDYMSYNPYNYHYYNSSLYYNSPWNNYTYWNYFYNPNCFCACVSGSYPVKTITRTPRQFDLSVYTPGTANTIKGGINIKGQSYGSTPGYSSRNYGSGKPNTNNYGNSGRNAGAFVREAFGGGNNSNIKIGGGTSGGSSSSPARGSSGGGSSNAGARKF